MKYKCPRCGYSKESEEEMLKHLHRKIKCKASYSNITLTSINDFLEKEPKEDPTKEDPKESINEPTREEPKEPIKEEPKEAPKDPTKENSKEYIKEDPKDPIKEDSFGDILMNKLVSLEDIYKELLEIKILLNKKKDITQNKDISQNKDNTQKYKYATIRD